MLSCGSFCYHVGWNAIIWDQMLSSGINVIVWDEMISWRTKCYHMEQMLSYWSLCYHEGWNVIIWSLCYHAGCNVIIWQMLSSGTNVIMWDEMLSFRTKCYHLELILSCGMEMLSYIGRNVTIWDQLLSSGAYVIMWDEIMKCYHLGPILSYWTNIIMCSKFYHVEQMLSCGSRCGHLGQFCTKKM